MRIGKRLLLVIHVRPCRLEGASNTGLTQSSNTEDGEGWMKLHQRQRMSDNSLPENISSRTHVRASAEQLQGGRQLQLCAAFGVHDF